MVTGISNMGRIDDLINLKASTSLTNRQIAQLSGVPYGTVIKIMSGQTKSPGVSRIDAIEQSILNFIRDESGSLDLSFGGRVGSDRRKTLADYYALPSDVRAELIDGAFYNISSPSIYHQEIVGNLYFAFRSFIAERGGSCRPILSPVDVQLDADDYTIVQPDLLILCDSSKQRERMIVGAPDFVVEVVSRWSKSRDYFLKADKYRAAGVREYWIVDPQQEKVVVYSHMEDQDEMAITIYSFLDQVPVGIFQDMYIDMGQIARAGTREY